MKNLFLLITCLFTLSCSPSWTDKGVENSQHHAHETMKIQKTISENSIANNSETVISETDFISVNSDTKLDTLSMTNTLINLKY
jgi:hypothetical protein